MGLLETIVREKEGTDYTIATNSRQLRRVRRGVLGRTRCAVRHVNALLRLPPQVVGIQQSAWRLFPAGQGAMTKQSTLRF